MENVKRVAQVTLPAISRKGHPSLFLKILSPLKKSEVVDEADDAREPATTCRVINLEDGKTYDYVAAALAVSALIRYPGGYVDKCFEISHSAEKLPGKDYYGVDVYEIECPAVADDLPSIAKPQAD
jgi:hypothetical protein